LQDDPCQFIISEELKRRKNELSYFKSLSIDESGSRIKQSFEKIRYFHCRRRRRYGSHSGIRAYRNKQDPRCTSNGLRKWFCKGTGVQNKYPVVAQRYQKGDQLSVDVLRINNLICLNAAGSDWIHLLHIPSTSSEPGDSGRMHGLHW